ncbi:hypothetical protein [Psychrobacillus sp. FSL K6-1464]|uniref:hypothetical protein n=1 Tax=Psychrobacillus sp. FSL K6-1464 TaxID=2921545 RepID=UPI0030FB3048
MPSFKDFAESDLDSVFLNPEEFGTPVLIEDELVVVVMDDEKMVERKLFKGAEGFHTEELLFYVKRNALSFYPRPDNLVVFDNVDWKITDVQEDVGLLTVSGERVSG